MALNKQKRDIKRKNRNRYSLKKHSGSKPRLSVYRSNQHICLLYTSPSPRD